MRFSSKSLVLAISLSLVFAQAQAASLAMSASATRMAPITRGALVRGAMIRQTLRKGLSMKSLAVGALMGAAAGAVVFGRPEIYRQSGSPLALDEDSAEDRMLSPLCVGDSPPTLLPMEYCGRRSVEGEALANGEPLSTPVYIPDVGAHIKYAKASVVLAANMATVVGGPGPLPPGCDAHHIVPAAENRSWAKTSADGARNILAMCKIDINDAINGVYLPAPSKNRPLPQCQGVQHSKVHTKDYYVGLRRNLERAYTENGCGENGVRGLLRNYRQQLENGIIPE